MPQVTGLAYRLETAAAAAVTARLNAIMDEEIVSVRKGKERRRRVRDFLSALAAGDGHVTFTLRHDPAGSLSITELLARLADLDPDIAVTRTGLTLAD